MDLLITEQNVRFSFSPIKCWLKKIKKHLLSKKWLVLWGLKTVATVTKLWVEGACLL